MSALQIKRKFIEDSAVSKSKLEADAVDSTKLKLLSGQALRVISAVSGEEKRLIEIDSNDKVLVNGQEVALKSQLDDLLGSSGSGLSLTSLDQRLDTAESKLATLESDATVEGSVAKAEADAKAYADGLASDLDTRLDVLEGTGAGSVAKAQADAQAYADSAISTAAAALQSELDDTQAGAGLSASGTYVQSSNPLLASATSLASADDVLASEIDIIKGPETQAGSIAKALKDAKDYVNDVIGVSSTAVAAFASLAAQMTDGDAATGVIDALGSVESRVDTAEADINILETDLAQEISDRVAAITQIASSTQLAIQSEANARTTAISAVSGRVTALEAVAHYKQKFVLSASDISNGYIELPREAKPNSIVASVGRLMIHEGAAEDFEVSVVGGVSRITFVGNLVSPSEEELSAGDVVHVKYMA